MGHLVQAGGARRVNGEQGGDGTRKEEEVPFTGQGPVGKKKGKTTGTDLHGVVVLPWGHKV